MRPLPFPGGSSATNPSPGAYGFCSRRSTENERQRRGWPGAHGLPRRRNALPLLWMAPGRDVGLGGAGALRPGGFGGAPDRRFEARAAHALALPPNIQAGRPFASSASSHRGPDSAVLSPLRERPAELSSLASSAALRAGNRLTPFLQRNPRAARGGIRRCALINCHRETWCSRPANRAAREGSAWPLWLAVPSRRPAASDVNLLLNRELQIVDRGRRRRQPG